jgi:hypothetical protein
MQLELSEADFSRALGRDAVKRLSQIPQEQVLGEGDVNALFDALPRVLSERFKRMLPSDFEIREITLKVLLSGSPFGVGLSGDATVKFGPKSKGI